MRPQVDPRRHAREVAAAARAVPDGDAVDVVIDGLGLRAQPPPTRVRVGLISRRWKRFLLNERELGYALLDAGYDVRLLALEDMTLYEQVAALRATTGLDGLVLEPNAIDARLDNHKVSLKFATSVAIFLSMSDQASRLFCSKGRRMTARSAASRRPRSCSRHHTSIFNCL